MDITLLICLFLFQLLIIKLYIDYKYTKAEGFGSSLSDEAVQNLSALYNSSNMTVDNLTITGTLKVQGDSAMKNIVANNITSTGITNTGNISNTGNINSTGSLTNTGNITTRSNIASKTLTLDDINFNKDSNGILNIPAPLNVNNSRENQTQTIPTIYLNNVVCTGNGNGYANDTSVTVLNYLHSVAAYDTVPEMSQIFGPLRTPNVENGKGADYSHQWWKVAKLNSSRQGTNHTIGSYNNADWYGNPLWR